MVITALALPTNRTDFFDWCLLVSTEGVQKLKKCAGVDLDIALERDRPVILGRMLDLLVESQRLGA